MANIVDPLRSSEIFEPGLFLIMNDEFDLLARVFFDLIFEGRKRLSDTSKFRLKKHNKDLVPALNDMANHIIEFFERYRNVSYDIQGIRDQGIDVLVKYQHNSTTNFIGFQVKSFDDLNQKDWLTKLKAQITDTLSGYDTSKLTDFYILFCTDAAAHTDKVRNAAADISKISTIKIHIVPPQNSLNFLELSDYSIGAYLKRKFAEGDRVVRNARQELSDLSLAQSAMIVEAAANLIEKNELTSTLDAICNSTFSQRVYQKWPNIPQYYCGSIDDANSYFQSEDSNPNPLDDFSILESHGYFDLQDNDTTHFDTSQFASLMAIMYDGKARYDYGCTENKWYTLTLLKCDEIEVLNKVILHSDSINSQ